MSHTWPTLLPDYAALLPACQQDSETDPLHDLAMGSESLRPLMPHATAFQLLRTPSLCYGGGLRLKRALLLDAFITVVPSDAFPVPAFEVLQGLTVHGAHCGSYRSVMLWEWLQERLPTYADIMPASDGDGGGAAVGGMA